MFPWERIYAVIEFWIPTLNKREFHNLVSQDHMESRKSSLSIRNVSFSGKLELTVPFATISLQRDEIVEFLLIQRWTSELVEDLVKGIKGA